MACKIKMRTVVALAVLACAFGLLPLAHAQENNAKTLETGTFHGKVHRLRAAPPFIRSRTESWSCA